VALLTAEALDLGNGNSLYAVLGQRLTNVVELEWLDDGGDELHPVSPLLSWRRQPAADA